MKIKFTPGHGLAIHIDGQLAGVITKPGASISPDDNGYYDCSALFERVLLESDWEPESIELIEYPKKLVVNLKEAEHVLLNMGGKYLHDVTLSLQPVPLY